MHSPAAGSAAPQPCVTSPAERPSGHSATLMPARQPVSRLTVAPGAAAPGGTAPAGGSDDFAALQPAALPGIQAALPAALLPSCSFNRPPVAAQHRLRSSWSAPHFADAVGSTPRFADAAGSSAAPESGWPAAEEALAQQTAGALPGLTSGPEQQALLWSPPAQLCTTGLGDVMQSLWAFTQAAAHNGAGQQAASPLFGVNHPAPPPLMSPTGLPSAARSPQLLAAAQHDFLSGVQQTGLRQRLRYEGLAPSPQQLPQAAALPTTAQPQLQLQAAALPQQQGRVPLRTHHQMQLPLPQPIHHLQHSPPVRPPAAFGGAAGGAAGYSTISGSLLLDTDAALPGTDGSGYSPVRRPSAALEGAVVVHP